MSEIQITHERQLSLSVADNRKSTNWTGRMFSVGSLYSRLQSPTRGVEPIAEYLAFSKSRQDDLKDVGGFVGGTLNGPRRKANAVVSRDMVTLDLDTIPPYGTEDVISKVEGLGNGYCVYSTRKHRPEAPRLRIIIPLARSVTPDEYDAISRRLAAEIGINMADQTTFEPSRLMYWPSCCADGEFIFRYADKSLCDADGVLASYTDWRDWSERPQVPGAVSYQKLAVKQGNPEQKPGIVGFFNRTYNVLSAMEKFLPGIYEPTDTDPDRYTYLEGSTTGGAIIYDNGNFLFSHHATDPCSGKLVNAFDLVRLHKFGDKDDAAAPDTPINRLPSFNAMCEFAISDPAVSSIMIQERREEALKDFADLVSYEQTATETRETETAKPNWNLDLSPKSGEIKPTINNARILLENDPHLKGKFALNQFANRIEVLGSVPWNSDKERRMWTDTDTNGLYWHLENCYRFNAKGAIDAALDLHSAKHAFNEVQDYINGLVWDGTPRLDTLLIDYLGAEDTPYTRAVCRKIFTAAVYRAMRPGCKFDNMLILCGPQGIGKSTLLKKMSRGWFNDSIRTFEGKEASELIQGVWLVEIAELDAFRRTEVSRIKQFLSLDSDRYRAAYAHNAKDFPRCCVFFGTSNESDFLQDMTGNRRFWPVDVGVTAHEKNVFDDLTEDVVTQIWAEAKMRWIIGEALYLTGDALKAAQEAQEAHRDTSSQEGMIADFISRQIPVDWQKWGLEQRRMFWSNTVRGEVSLKDRDTISAVEIYCELFNNPQSNIKRSDTREINAILAKMPGWRRARNAITVGPYGQQRCFIKPS